MGHTNRCIYMHIEYCCVHGQLWQVCLPISLGIFYLLHTLLEQAAHQLDPRMAKEKSVLGGKMFQEYSKHLMTVATLKEERDAHILAVGVLEQLATRIALCATTETSVEAQVVHVREAISSYRKKTEEMVCFVWMHRDQQGTS